MTKFKLYQIAAIGLFLLNIALVSFIVFAPRGPGGMPGNAPKTLDFDAGQHERFLEYANAHKELMRGYNTRQVEILKAHFEQLNTKSANTPEPLPQTFEEIERLKVTSTYDHFLEVKTLLRPTQEEQFPAFMEGVLGQILIGPERK